MLRSAATAAVVVASRRHILKHLKSICILSDSRRDAGAALER